jgi:site-specific recombinase XerD
VRVSAQTALAIYERSMRLRGHSPETIKENLATVKRFLAHADRPPRRLRRREVEGYLADLQRAEVAGSTMARALGVLRMFFRSLAEAGVIEQDPTVGMTTKESEPRPPVVPTEAGVAKLLGAADVVPRSGASSALALRDRALAELLYGLGLRSAEARAAQVGDLNLADGTLNVRPAKRGPPRVLPLPPAALPHLRRYLKQARPKLVRRRQDSGHLLVTKTGRPLTRSDVVKVVAKLALRASVRCYPHALRRALATHLVMAGVNVRAVQTWLGHGSLEVTQGYVVVGRAELRRAVDLLDRPQPQRT